MQTKRPINIQEVFAKMQAHSMHIPNDFVSLNIDISKELFLAYFGAIISRDVVWNDSYLQIIDWMKQNANKGLFLYGAHGTGKTILARYVLPAILLEHQRKVVRYFDMGEAARNIDEVMKNKIIALDDVGTESVTFEYGNKRLAFAEIMDRVEKDNKLVIITTNLDGKQLEEMYGRRTYERVVATTKRVLIQGKSNRR